MQVESEEHDMMNIYYQNTRGLNTKTQEFYTSVLSSEYPIVAITETWIQTGVCDAELFGDSYSVFRRDRDLVSHSLSRGGGVLLGISRLYTVVRLDLSNFEMNCPKIDMVGCKIHINNHLVYIYIYIGYLCCTKYFIY